MEARDKVYLTLPSVLGVLVLGIPVSNGHFVYEQISILRHMTGFSTAKSVHSPLSASKPSSAIIRGALDIVYLALPPVLGVLLLGIPVFICHFGC
jgi:hypothetical protein